MRGLGRHTITLVWLMLMVATGISWWLGTGRPTAPHAAAAATVSILVLAMIKVRFVILYFMEVCTAPRALRLICDAWVGVLGAVMIGLYLLR